MGMRPFWYSVCIDKHHHVQTDVPYEEITNWTELIGRIRNSVEE